MHFHSLNLHPPRRTWTTPPPRPMIQSSPLSGLARDTVTFSSSAVRFGALVDLYGYLDEAPVPVDIRPQLKEEINRMVLMGDVWKMIADNPQESFEDTFLRDSAYGQVVYHPKGKGLQPHITIAMNCPHGDPAEQAKYTLGILLDESFEPIAIASHPSTRGFLAELYGSHYPGIKGALYGTSVLRPPEVSDQVYTHHMHRLWIHQAMLQKPLPSVPPGFVTQMVDTLAGYPSSVIMKLRNQHYRLVCAPRLVDVFPELEGQVIPSTKSKATWNQATGLRSASLYMGDLSHEDLRQGLDDSIFRDWYAKEREQHSKPVIAVAHWYENHKGKRFKNPNPVNTLHHEVGHALDAAQGWLSLKEGFTTAWQKDVAAMTQRERARQADALDVEKEDLLDSVRARQETFANVHAYLKHIEPELHSGNQEHATRNINRQMLRIFQYVAQSVMPKYPVDLLPPAPDGGDERPCK